MSVMPSDQDKGGVKCLSRSTVVHGSKSALSWDWHTAFVFAVFGFGPSWMVVNCLFMEVPYFEKSLPESYCIAAFLTLAVALGVLFPLCLYVYTSYTQKNLDHSIAVPATMVFSVASMLFTAIFWHTTINHHSVLLFVCAFLGGGVGGLVSVLIYPFLSQYTSDCSTSFRAGGSLAFVICSGVAVGQEPGAEKSRFNPTVFFLIFSGVLSLAFFSYQYILETGCGLLETDKDTDTGDRDNNQEAEGVELGMENEKKKKSQKQVLTTEIEMQTYQINPLRPAEPREGDRGKDGDRGAISDAVEGDINLSVFRRIDNSLIRLEAKFQDLFTAALVSIMPFLGNDENRGWWIKTQPYMLAIAFVDFNQFGFVSALYPIALRNACAVWANGDFTAAGLKAAQGKFLQVSYQFNPWLSLLCTLLSYRVRIPLRYILSIHTTTCVVIYTFSLPAFAPTVNNAESGINSIVVAPLVLSCFLISSACTFYTLTVVWRFVGNLEAQPLEKDRDATARLLGYTDQISALLGASLAMVLASFDEKCF